MAAGEPFHYTTSQATSYRFIETGVAKAPTSELKPHFKTEADVLWADNTPAWSLVDSNVDGTLPEYILTLPTLFTVHMTGMKPLEYKWTSHVTSHRRLLNPWTCREILQCLPLCRDFRNLDRTIQDVYTTESDIAVVVAQSGPFVRDVLHEIMHPGHAAKDIAMHLQPVTSIDALFNLLGGLLLDSRPAFDALFVRRRDSRAAQITEIL